MRVVATSIGYDGVCLREPGDEFDMPDGSCDKVPVKDMNGKVIPNQFEPPAWFKPVEKRRSQEPDETKDLV